MDIIHLLIRLSLFFTFSLSSSVLIISCGKDSAPSPLYQTQSSKIQKEIRSREQKSSKPQDTHD